VITLSLPTGPPLLALSVSAIKRLFEGALSEFLPVTHQVQLASPTPFHEISDHIQQGSAYYSTLNVSVLCYLPTCTD
jgi:hypothetical protein